MAWAKDGTPQTLTSSNSNLTITDLTPFKFMTYLSHIVGTGSSFIQRTQLGYGSIDTGSNYAIRWSHNGASDTTVGSQVDIPYGHEGESNSAFMINYSINIATEEKIRIGFAVRANTAGAANAPQRTEQVSKWSNASNQADQLKIFSDSNPYYAAGSNLSVLGTD